ncbi:AAC(3) family N-acetyltransferase [Marinomonas ostreistagni]|uniref:AAC(3) family N-acetyltransferase n=1 Tax=Marinomonas ostreistagni TaxID=359209 RepID=UPI0019520D0C|nr:AAC(3) family N-acetyltransferase [Marinomonas ostreistagni]MBM6551157.1 AAC(3) family N-acetyltransferase [Marinomonas ostreistagni]
MIDYTKEDLINAYRALGVSEGRTVYITGNLGRLGRYEHKAKSALLADHLDAIQQLIGATGTLVVPTHSFQMVQSETAFDPQRTPSETGPFTQYVLEQPGAVRQFHPFSSSTALGAQAQAICGGGTRHVYGPGSPFAQMIEHDALFISLGKEATHTISIVHHLEFTHGVPYRYVKEFLKAVVRDAKPAVEPFYLHVLYRDMDVQRDRNRKIMASFQQRHKLHSVPLGRSIAESFSMQNFYEHVHHLMLEDPYIWLTTPPQTRPYQT